MRRVRPPTVRCAKNGAPSTHSLLHNGPGAVPVHPNDRIIAEFIIPVTAPWPLPGAPYLKECGRQAFLRQNIHIPSLPPLRQNARRWLENLVLSLTAYADREHDEPTFVRIHGIHSTAVGLSRIRGVAHVLLRRPSPDRRRGPPTHTFVLPPQHARCGWEAA